MLNFISEVETEKYELSTEQAVAAPAVPAAVEAPAVPVSSFDSLLPTLASEVPADRSTF